MNQSKEAPAGQSDPYAFSEDFEEPPGPRQSAGSKSSTDNSKPLLLEISGEQLDASKTREVGEAPVASLAAQGASSSSKQISSTATTSGDMDESVMETSSGAKPMQTSGLTAKPTVPALDLLKKTEKESDLMSSPLGSPLTPDSVDNAGSEREVSPASRRGTQKSRRARPGAPDTEASGSKRKPAGGDHFGPGSPQTVMSERRQLALLRQQARDTEKAVSPDTSFSREGPSTPSSTSSTRESRSANRRDGKGETPLHVACKKGDLAAARKLLDDGADVNAADNAGWTPLHEAANHGREDVTRLLLKSGANHGARAVDGLTPLMDAVINGHVNIAELLLKSGADPKCENDKGQTCLDLSDEPEVFKDVLQPCLKEPRPRTLSISSAARKRKRDTSSMEKDNKDGGSRARTTSLPKKEPEIVTRASAKAPAAAAPLDKVKDPAESQYEDISDDEEEAPRDVTGIAQNPVVAVTAVPPVAVSSAATAPVDSTVSSPVISISSAVTIPTPPVAPVMVPIKPVLVPKLRPPSPPLVVTPPTMPATSAASDTTPAVPVKEAQPAATTQATVDKSSEPKKTASTGKPDVSGGAVETKNVLAVSEKAPGTALAEAVTVPVHEASVVPATEQPPQPVATPGGKSQALDTVTKPSEKIVATPEKKPPPPVPPVTTPLEVPTTPVVTEAPVAELKIPLVASSPIVSVEPPVSTTSGLAPSQETPAEMPPVHSATTSVITESPVSTLPATTTTSVRTSPTVLVQPVLKIPTLSIKMPPASPQPTTIPPSVLTTPLPVMKVPAEKKEKKSDKSAKEKDVPMVKVIAPSFLPQGPAAHERLTVTVKRPATRDGSSRDASGDDGGGKESVFQRPDDSSQGATASSVVAPDVDTPAKGKPADAGARTAGEASGSQAKKQKEEKPVKPMTRAQRANAAQAAAQVAGPGRRRKEKPDEKQPRVGRPSKRAAADADIQSGEDAGGLDTKPKRLPSRLSPKKLRTGKDEPPAPAKLSVADAPKSPLELLTESPARLPFKKRLGIRNEIEEFINQRRQVEENWKKYSNNFPMKIFPKHCNDYLIMRKNYSPESALPKKLDAPLALPPPLKDFFIEQSEERARLMRAHLVERDRLIMGAEQETMRLHQRFSRISAGITIPYSACMIISEQDSNRSFQTQEQDDRTRNASRNRTSPRDLIKWLEESDDKFDFAKKELLTRHRLEAAMLRSKQRLDWAWKASDLNMVDPSCRSPEELPNLYVPEVVVEDFVLLPDQ